jgi:hypothetical protein
MISLVHHATKPQNACGIEPHAAESSWRLDAPPIAALDGVEQARFAQALDRITRTATAMRHAQNRDPTIGREILVALSERRHLGAQPFDLDAQRVNFAAQSGEPILGVNRAAGRPKFPGHFHALVGDWVHRRLIAALPRLASVMIRRTL